MVSKTLEMVKDLVPIPVYGLGRLVKHEKQGKMAQRWAKETVPLIGTYQASVNVASIIAAVYGIAQYLQ